MVTCLESSNFGSVMQKRPFFTSSEHLHIHLRFSLIFPFGKKLSNVFELDGHLTSTIKSSHIASGNAPNIRNEDSKTRLQSLNDSYVIFPTSIKTSFSNFFPRCIACDSNIFDAPIICCTNVPLNVLQCAASYNLDAVTLLYQSSCQIKVSLWNLVNFSVICQKN